MQRQANKVSSFVVVSFDNTIATVFFNYKMEELDYCDTREMIVHSKNLYQIVTDMHCYNFGLSSCVDENLFRKFKGSMY